MSALLTVRRANINCQPEEELLVKTKIIDQCGEIFKIESVSEKFSDSEEDILVVLYLSMLC